MLIAQMVARNEANRYLAEVLGDLTHKVDKIVFTDDCSTDETPEIAREYIDDDCVYQLLGHVPVFVQDESALRNIAWRNLENHASEGDWILAIDADEKFFPTADLDEWLKQKRWDVLGVKFYHMWNETHYRADKAWAPSISSRLFRYKEGGAFKSRRLACGSEPIYVAHDIRARKFNPNTGLRMQHLGYLRDEDKEIKFERYMNLDKGDFHSLNHIKSIMDLNPILEEWKER